MTIEPNWTTFVSGESVTFKCDITGDKDSDWFYSMYKDDCSGEYQCLFQHGGSTTRSNKIYLTVSACPHCVSIMAESWSLSNSELQVDHPSAGWSFYWYKAVPRLSDNSYSYELLPGSENGLNRISSSLMDKHTQQICVQSRKRGSSFTVRTANASLSGLEVNINSAASLTVSPDSVQHFTKNACVTEL
ncbi:hypothetical protein F7725_027959 [Dissostichus mawsoni]|uniref:Ig-like domain-containing protein n=1 Tax=Dissostichus mawsoni TaxID=36200 RepID=A0A7J5XEN8_DISMA|nr:hypothetical protein F7725_027959 [Dissostichus mawsoni]